MSNWGGWQSSEDMCEEQIACLLLCGSVLGQASHDQASGFSGAPSALSLSLVSSAAASAGMPGTEGTINIIFDFESQRQVLQVRLQDTGHPPWEIALSYVVNS